MNSYTKMPKFFIGSLVGLVCFLGLTACSKDGSQGSQELWIYTSLYKDTVADLEPRLKKAFPGVKFNFFQAGSEDVAAKVNAEFLGGSTKADVLISSDRFWYEDMARQGKLHAFRAQAAEKVPEQLRHPDKFYSTLSIPVMILCYNQEAIAESEAPKTFKELTQPKWKGKFTGGSPLESGTNFTTLATLVHHYGWEFAEGLKKNGAIIQGGNSAVLRRIQTRERPIGWVLLENVLRFQETDQRLKVIYPEDGVVLQSNVAAIVKKQGTHELAEKFLEWMYGREGQEAMTRSYMYSPLEEFDPPKGAPPFAELRKKAFPWNKEFIDKIVAERDGIKEKFTQIMFR